MVGFRIFQGWQKFCSLLVTLKVTVFFFGVAGVWCDLVSCFGNICRAFLRLASLSRGEATLKPAAAAHYFYFLPSDATEHQQKWKHNKNNNSNIAVKAYNKKLNLQYCNVASLVIGYLQLCIRVAHCKQQPSIIPCPSINYFIGMTMMGLCDDEIVLLMSQLKPIKC